MFDLIRFVNNSQDPEYGGTSIEELDFGDGTVVHPVDGYVNHRYAADGDYTAKLTVRGSRGRTAATTTISVRTHDVGITGFTTPPPACVGATKSLEVAVANIRYDETVTVTLYRSTSAGYAAVGTLTKPVPARATAR